MQVRFPLSRRQMLAASAVGFGQLALTSLLAEASPPDPLAPRPPHFPTKVKRVIFLFMKGGPSQVDTFDYKPLLLRHLGRTYPLPRPRVVFAATSMLLASPWRFRKYGTCGMKVSELFPNVAQCVDDICFIHSVHGTNPAHGAATLRLHTGSDNLVRPSIGSWVTYGLGTETRNLPGFITICPTLAHGGHNNWGSAFLPAVYQGTPLGNASIPADQARVGHIQNTRLPLDVQWLQLDHLAQMNREHQERTGPKPSLEARINASRHLPKATLSSISPRLP